MPFISKLRMLLSLGQGVKGLTLGLSEKTAGPDPLRLFGEWFEQAKDSGIALPEAMTLATASAEGAPSARLVLLKGFDERGFVLFTNYNSRKSAELDANPRAALVCHWTVLQRQVRIEGITERVSTDESDTYFHTRSRGSQIGAWASSQSATLTSVDELQQRVREHEKKFADQPIPLPPFWGGFRVIPQRIEFWQGRTNRLHDRLCYERVNNDWLCRRLYP